MLVWKRGGVSRHFGSYRKSACGPLGESRKQHGSGREGTVMGMVQNRQIVMT
jgi:hypothetical protein